MLTVVLIYDYFPLMDIADTIISEKFKTQAHNHKIKINVWRHISITKKSNFDVFR